MKRILSLMVSFALLISLIPTAFATTPEAIEAANELYRQGLFNGTGKDANGNPIFELDRAPTRHEAITMLVRLLGKEAEAQSHNWAIPFTDVASWAKPYVGYAYTNGLTDGTSTTTFSGEQTISASQYLTFVLRTLGYTSGSDFQWNSAWELSDKIGLTDGRYNTETVDFTRGDVAIISNMALDCYLKGTTTLLRANLSQNLITENNITGNELDTLEKACAKCLIEYQIVLKEIENSTIASDIAGFMSNATSAYNDITLFKGYLLETIQACGNYDNTQTLKENADHIHSALVALPAPKNLNDFDNLRSYLQQYLAVMMGASGAWNTFKAESSKLSATG